MNRYYRSLTLCAVTKFTGCLIDSREHNTPRKLVLVGINLARVGVYNKNRFSTMNIFVDVKHDISAPVRQ